MSKPKPLWLRAADIFAVEVRRRGILFRTTFRAHDEQQSASDVPVFMNNRTTYRLDRQRIQGPDISLFTQFLTVEA